MKAICGILCLVIIVLISCSQENSPTGTDNLQVTDSSQEATLLFSSGFEGPLALTGPHDPLNPDNADYQFIRGTDSETGFTWPITLDYLGVVSSGIHLVDIDDTGKAISNKIVTTTGHDGNQTKVLYSIEKYIVADLCTQSPYELLDIKKGQRDLYIRYWMKIDSTSVTQKKDTWRALFEYKTIDYDTGDGMGTGFRLIAFIYTDPADGIPYWHWQGDSNPENPIWEIDNKSIRVPLDEWFLTEYFWHWSNGNDGKATWRVNGQIIGEHTGPTTRNSKPIDFIMPWQIYGDSNPKHQWIDDIEIWSKIPDIYK